MKKDLKKQQQAIKEVKQEIKQHHLDYLCHINKYGIEFAWENFKTTKEFKKWLVIQIIEQYEDVCWGTKADCMFFARDYQEINGRKFDKELAKQNIECICGLYVLFDYGDYYLED